MINNLSHRGKIRVIIFSGALLVIVSVLAVVGLTKAAYYKNELHTTYQMSLNNLVNYVTHMDESLEKCLYSGTPTMISKTTGDLWRDSYEAQQILSELPLDSREMESTNSFLAKVAEFSKSLGVSAAAGKSISEKDHLTLRKLKQHVSSLKNSLVRLETVYEQDNSVATMPDISFESPERLSKSALSTLSLTSTQETLTNIPQLIYDGPYSDSIAVKDPEALKGLTAIDTTQAAKRAAKYLACSEKELKRGKDENSNIASYVFSFGTRTAAISKMGGRLVYMTDSDIVKVKKVSRKACIKTAQRYLKSIGIEGMTHNYYEEIGNTLTVNFHYSDNSVKYYPDLIKVNVRMDSGTVSAVDCRSYLTNHTARNADLKAKINLIEAKSRVNKYLSIRSVSMAVIPTDSEKEKYVYEFFCKGENGEDILVYIDAETGMEADILILVTNKNGTLAY